MTNQLTPDRTWASEGGGERWRVTPVQYAKPPIAARGQASVATPALAIMGGKKQNKNRTVAPGVASFSCWLVSDK